MKRSHLVIAFILFILFSAATATAAERYFKFEIDSEEQIGKLTKIISIDRVDSNTVYAYANDKEYDEFLKMGIPHEVLPAPSTLADVKMAQTKDAVREWDSYPTYSAYVSMMYQYATDYPSICRIVNAGQSEEGRDILFAVISDNVSTEENEPEVMYTSTMHGDETVGYVLMLRLIDSLLVSYGTDSLATRLIDSCEIWINPNANPDGTYAGGDNTVSGATRYNSNFVDLNRNFPDFQDGPHPDGNSYQAETIVMMDIADAQNFALSANFHGGAEVVNYPWDTWATLHPDNDWYFDISTIYADSAQYYSPTGYLTYLGGVTNGYAWYEVDGGRQDYMNYFQGGREVTIELSNTKLPSASQLPSFWNYNRVSLFDWLENGLYGIRGLVTDNVTSLPVDAKITVLGHDTDNSEVFTDPDVGDYHRMIEAGRYDLEFSAPGYFPDTVHNVTVTDWNTTIVDMALQPLPNEPVFVFNDNNYDNTNPGETVTMDITLENVGGGNAYNTVGRLFTDDALISITQDTSTFPTIAALGGIETSLSNYVFEISPSCTTFHVVDFSLELNADGVQDTVDFTFMVGDRVVFFSDDFSFDQGWTGYGGSGEWSRGPAVGGSGSDGSGGPDPDYDHTTTGDEYVLGNDLTSGSGGDYNSGLSSTYWITSPYFDCSDITGVQMRFYRWLGVEDDSYDHAYLQVYNGTSWVTIYENGSSDINESAWSEQFYDVSLYADNNPDFQIRFGIGPTDGSVQYCGWNIDDFELKGYGTTPEGDPELSYQPFELRDSLHLGQSATDTVIAHNYGDALLRIRFFTSNEWLSFNSDQQNVDPGDSLILPVTINTASLSPGNHIGLIEYTSNDPLNSSGTIDVLLHIYSPDISITETSISETVNADEQKTHPFVIANDGPGILQYDISRQMFSGKETGAAKVTTEKDLIGYHPVETDKPGSGAEPYYTKIDKSSGGPDNWGYSWIDSDESNGPQFSWIDITSVGTSVTLDDDDSSAAIPTGFDFPFYENIYSSLNITSNGILTFGGGSTARTNTTMPDNNQPNNMIAMWWDDLDPSAYGNIYYYYDAAENRFIVSFINIPNYSSSAGTGSLNFQAVLYSNGKILLQYDVMDPGSDAAGLQGATVGIENAAGDDGLEVVFNSSYMHDQLAIQFTAADWLSVTPASGSIDPFSNITVNVEFDATDMEDGEYTGQMTITSNDPDTPSLDVPISMTVQSQLFPPDAPDLMLPENNQQGVAQPVVLDWSDVLQAESYGVQIDTLDTFNEILRDTTVDISEWNVDGLIEGETYFWRVRGQNQAGWGDYSSVWSFTTEISWVCGDASGDGLVNLIDITALINYLYKEGPAPDPEKAGDVDSSGTVNLLDITYLISYLYKEGPDPNCPQ